MYGFVTDSPLFDSPGGFNRALTNEEDIRLRASAQRAMEAGRPMTMAEMYGKPQQLFRKLSGFGESIMSQVVPLSVVSGTQQYKCPPGTHLRGGGRSTTCAKDCPPGQKNYPTFPFKCVPMSAREAAKQRVKLPISSHIIKKPPIKLIIIGLAAIALVAYLAKTKLPEATR